MGKFVPTKLTASSLLASLYVYSKQLQLLDEELARVKDDQNIMTCRDEYIESIWGTRLGQVFTSDFNITQYRDLLVSLVKVSLQDSTNQNIKDTVHAYFPLAGIDIVEFWKSPAGMVGYDWQNTSFKFRGAGDTPIVGNVWNGNHPYIPDLETLGFFLFGVQIFLRAINGADIPKIEQYVIPAIETFVKPAGIYYRIVVTDIDLLISERIKTPSLRRNPFLDSILGFGIMPFGSPVPNPVNDHGFGSPSLPEYIV